MAKGKKCNYCGLEGLKWTTVDGKYKLAYPNGAIHTIEECKTRNPRAAAGEAPAAPVFTPPLPRSAIVIPVTSGFKASPVVAAVAAGTAVADEIHNDADEPTPAPASSLAKVAAARAAKPAAIVTKATLAIDPSLPTIAWNPEQGVIAITLNSRTVFTTLAEIHRLVENEDMRVKFTGHERVKS
jgi:hypothetical protein